MFGLYVHIPYCLQRCSYCDFATYVYDQILPPEEYVSLLCQELDLKLSLVPQQELSSIYFGGGTPSLLSSSLILSILDHIAKSKLTISSQTEITLEINPATLDIPKVRELITGGINRFSVGAQTFNDSLLKAAGRKHTKDDTLQTLDLLQSKNVNYSFDLLFALPRQTLNDLENDLKIIRNYAPPHLSAYCLTVPSGHPMSFHRASEDHQLEMFQMIVDHLSLVQLSRYEISNFAKTGFESKHNLLYWQDQPYLGIGLSSHSYLKHLDPWGQRFWNPSSIDKYKELIVAKPPHYLAHLKAISCSESLTAQESLFDFCHTALRLDSGLEKKLLFKKFKEPALSPMLARLRTLCEQKLVVETPEAWRLTASGLVVSNLVFEKLSD